MSLTHICSQRASGRSPGARCLLALLALAMGPSCGPNDEPAPPPPPIAPGDFKGRVAWRVCRGDLSQWPTGPTESWQRAASSLTARGEPRHALHDRLATRERDLELVAHASYGALGRELVGERVELYIHGCQARFDLLAVGVTDAQGVARFTIPERDVPLYGEYDLVLRVAGDDTMARATLRVLPATSRFVAFELDEALSEEERAGRGGALGDLFERIGLEGFKPTARPGAAPLTRAYRALGYEVIYFSSRPPVLTKSTREWLDQGGFAPGTYWFAERASPPRSERAEADQIRALLGLRARGYVLDVAYVHSAESERMYQQGGAQAVRRVDEAPISGDLNGHSDREVSPRAPIKQPFDPSSRSDLP